MIRRAVPSDLEQLVSCAKLFTNESGLPLTFNDAKARAAIWAMLHTDALDFIVDAEDGVVVGVVIVTYESTYYDETCAYVDKLFVHREFRGRGTSDALVEAVVDACRKRGASLIFASATAGMGEAIEKLFVRLFRRHGFKVLGRIIMRKV